MGRDKYENEKLIEFGFEEDIWFHVDNLSSAHVYVRMPKGKTIEDISSELLLECAALCKSNSIQGCKLSTVDIVYTPWSNLKKTAMMDVGQVSFVSDKLVKKCKVEKNNAVVNRLEKTKNEIDPDFKREKEEYDAEKLRLQKKENKEKQLKEKQEKEEYEKIAKAKSYDNIMKEEYMVTNADIANKNKSAKEYEEDFM